MITTATIGYPRIGPKRELKKVLESYWKGDVDENELQKTAKELRKNVWTVQKDNGIDLITSNDFSFYDQILDMICLLGAVPKRYKWSGNNVDLKTYFAMARGSQTKDLDVGALEMTKWFDTNYHYIVPELDDNTEFNVDLTSLLAQINETKEFDSAIKPVLIGPLTYLYLSAGDEDKKLHHLPKLINAYQEILEKLSLSCFAQMGFQISQKKQK